MGARDPSLPPIAVTDGAGIVPERYVLPKLFELLTGYTPKAVERKIQDGVWREGREFKRAPDGRILVDREGFRRWVESR